MYQKKNPIHTKTLEEFVGTNTKDIAEKINSIGKPCIIFRENSHIYSLLLHYKQKKEKTFNRDWFLFQFPNLYVYHNMSNMPYEDYMRLMA